MSSAEATGGLLAQFSDDLARAVEAAGQAVVGVKARRRVPADGVTPATIGSAENVRVGHFVLALGRSGPGAPSASSGIVSAVGGPWRSRRGASIEGYFHADLALYPGNSGGPLADARGRVVGINSMVVPPRLALAVPSAAVARFLAPGGRARLGVRTQRVALPPPLARRLGLPHEYALMIVEVMPDEPAAAAGLLPGDVLLAADDTPLDSPSALAARLEASAGAAVRL